LRIRRRNWWRRKAVGGYVGQKGIEATPDPAQEKGQLVKTKEGYW